MQSRLTSCTSEDVREIARIRRSIEEEMAEAGNKQWPLGSLTEELVAKQVAAGEFFALRTPDGDLVATIRILDEDPAIWGEDAGKGVYLHTLMTNPAYRGQGLGVALLGLMDEVARRLGVGRVRLDCVPNLVSFYEKHGYTDTGEINSPENPRYRHTHLMERIVETGSRTAGEAIAPLGVEYTPPAA